MNEDKPLRKPSWLRRRLPASGKGAMVHQTLDDLKLHTVCDGALCPNRGQCYGEGTATFLLLGPDCTRRCAFCAVQKNEVKPPDLTEPKRVAQAAARLKLEYVVLTMVTRDDLPDGGAALVAESIARIKQTLPNSLVEALISDLGGNEAALNTVLKAEPQVLNHNLETVPRLYASVRPQAVYRRSLELLARAARAGFVTKSGLMLGLGESPEELAAVMDDLLEAGCKIITLGQYLAPSKKHLPITRYVEPDEFEELKELALSKGFAAAASAPFVRSSYNAKELYEAALGPESA